MYFDVLRLGEPGDGRLGKMTCCLAFGNKLYVDLGCMCEVEGKSRPREVAARDSPDLAFPHHLYLAPHRMKSQQ